MEYMKYSLLFASLCFTGQTNSEECQVDRNEYNEYPFMVKIVFDGEMRAHGSLMSPLRVLSAYAPLQGLKGKKKLWPKLDFTMHRFGKGGALQCSITRKLERIFQPDGNVDMAFYLLEKEFPVTLSRPFLYNRLEDLEKGVYLKNFKKTKNKESCELPVFNTDSDNVKIKVDIVSFVSEDSAEYERWKKVSCNGNLTCIKRSFYAVDPINRLPKFQQYSGAVMICRNQPLGIMNKVMEDMVNQERITRFERLGYVALVFRGWAEKEWAKGNPTTTTTTKPTRTTENPDTNALSSIPTATSQPDITVSTIPSDTYDVTKRTKRTTAIPTYESSKIPNAPSMTIGRTTTQTTPEFVRTIPNRILHKSSAISPVPSSILKLCNVYLLLKYMEL